MTDTAFYADMTATALELLTDFGQAITLTAPPVNQGGYDDAGNPVAESPGVTCSGVGAKLNYTADTKAAAMQRSGTAIVDGDCYLLFQASSGTPAIGMATTLSGVVWRVVAVTPLEPAGILVHYNLQIRR